MEQLNDMTVEIAGETREIKLTIDKFKLVESITGKKAVSVLEYLSQAEIDVLVKVLSIATGASKDEIDKEFDEENITLESLMMLTMAAVARSLKGKQQALKMINKIIEKSSSEEAIEEAMRLTGQQLQ